MILQIISELIRGSLKDPRIGFTTVTRVDLTPDLSDCFVYVTTFGDDKAREESLLGLNSAAGFIRTRLAREMKLRKVPKLFFKEDKQQQRADHIFKVMEEIKREEMKEDGGDEDETSGS